MHTLLSSKRVLFVVNDAGFFLSHRLPIALEAAKQGCTVAIACPKDAKSEAFAGHGFEHLPTAMVRGGLSPIGELRALIELDRIMQVWRPDLVHLITSKPIIYGGLVTRRRGIPAIAAVSGLGHIFIDDSAKAKLLRKVALTGYRAAMARPGLYPIFQNRDNIQLFEDAGAIYEKPTLVHGSGADLARFDPAPSGNDVPRIVLPARMLFAKGVAEFVEAAKRLKSGGVEAEFQLVGDPDPANPASIPLAQLKAWDAEGAVMWEPHRSDIEAVLKASDIVALPSHNEGFPKTLVDAAAAGRAVVTNDVTGCRDAIIADQTGLLAVPHNVHSLADQMHALIEDPEKRLAFGAAGRALAEERYSIETIVGQHLDLYQRALAAGGQTPDEAL